jgi:DNA-binding MarR family transcriptional regulator
LKTTRQTGLVKPKSLEDMLLYRISQLLAVAGAPITRLCEGRYGITRREWRLLALLAGSKGMLSSQLAEKAALDRARTSRSITALQAKKLLRRKTVHSDQRQVWVELTEAGQALYKQLWPTVRAHHHQLLHELSATQTAQLDAMLHALQARAQLQLDGYIDLPKANRRVGGTRQMNAAQHR